LRCAVRLVIPALSPGCRAVELSRLRRAAVEAVVEAFLSSLSRFVEADSMWLRVELLSRAVEGCRVSLSRLSSYVECAVELENGTCSFAILHEAL